MRPRHDARGIPLRLRDFRRIDSHVGRSTSPGVLQEELGPRVEACPSAPCSLHPVGRLPSAAAHDGLDEARRRIVPMNIDRLVLHTVAQKIHAAQRLLGRNLAVPLERRLRLGNEQRDRRTHPHVTAMLGRHGSLRSIVGALHKARDALDVVVGLGGQADHEVKLAAAPPRLKRGVDGSEQVVFRHVLVDHVPQALRTRLGREGKAALLLPRDELCHVDAERVEALGRKRDAHALAVARMVQLDEDIGNLRMVGRGKRGQTHLVVTSVSKAIEHRRHHVVRRALAHRTVHHAGLAEAAPARASTQHLDRKAIVHALGIGNDARLPPRAFREAREQALLNMLGNARLERLDP